LQQVPLTQADVQLVDFEKYVMEEN